MKIRDITTVLEKFAPPELQESYDNAGLIIGSPDTNVTGVLICLDISLAVIQEAKEKKCNLIISHHPPLFQAIKKINGKTLTEEIIIELIRANIAAYAVHTNLDNVQGGINEQLANLLALSNKSFIEPKPHLLKKLVTFCPTKEADKVRAAICKAGAGHIGNYDCCTFNINGQGTFRANENANPFVGKKNILHIEAEVRIETIFPAFLQQTIIESLLESHPYEEVAYDIYPLDNSGVLAGSGIIGTLPKDLSIIDFLKLLKKKLNSKGLRYCKGKTDSVRKVAICSGSGSFLINKALSLGADAFITADVKYHDFQAMENRILLIDAGHFETEIGVKDLLRVVLSEKFPNFALFVSSNEKNPVTYI